MGRVVNTLGPGGDMRGDWKEINSLALNFAEVEQRLGKALADIERLKRARRGGGGWTIRGTWADATAYSVDDVVIVIGSGQGTYVCLVAHTSDDEVNAPWLGAWDDTEDLQYWQLLPNSAVGVWI
jgi:hypothetical protein